MIRVLAILALAAAAAAPARAQSDRADGVVADLSDRRIEITSGFTGAEVLLFGLRDGAGDVVAALRGPANPVVVRQKRRRLGMWLNRRGVIFDAAPGYYAVASSRPLADIAPPALLAAHGIGLDNLIGPPRNAAPGTELAEHRAALARLMKAGGRYREAPDGISFIDDRLFRAAFALPSDAPPGRYAVDVLLIAGGAVVDRQTDALEIGRTGFGAAMFDFAHSRPLAYGAFAAIVALLAGWIAAALFRRR